MASRHSRDSGSMSTATVPSVKAFFRVMRTRQKGRCSTRSCATGGLAQLALVAGVVAFYLREGRRHPELDDEEDRPMLVAKVVLRLGCLLFVVRSVSALRWGLILGRCSLTAAAAASPGSCLRGDW